MKTIRKILREKGHNVWKVSPDKPVIEALQLMAEKGIGAALVMEGEKLVGILSERDYARKVILKGKSSKEMLVKEIMSYPPIFITPDNTNEQGLALMSAKYIRHLPVMEDGLVVGVVSIGDLVKSVIEEQKIVIDRLEKYILANTSIT
ncbi:MAG: CBS domain-containing protein [Chloroflexi bacterium]|nr:CBS domain-containing protein [Chloroflexota bacterium]